MQKFKDLEYKRVDFDEEIKKVQKFEEDIKNAKSSEELKKIYMDSAEDDKETDTMISIAHVRNTVNMNDEFYDAEMKYIYENAPKLSVPSNNATQTLLNSPYFDGLADEFGDIFVKNHKNSLKLSNEATVQNQIEEGNLTQQYSKIAAKATTTFRGEECNFYGLLKHMESTDRAERKEAFEAWANLYESISDELDEIYTKLVNVREDKAKKLGFNSFIEYIYLSRRRFDYDAKDVANFRKQVREIIVPACAKLREQQRQRLGVETLHYYDEALIFPEGNANPIGDKDYMIKMATQMYHELSAETGEFFDFMVEHELFDLETKPGKHQGGYCTYFSKYGAPFIFSNFNGTAADVEVLTHEAGHAFAGYTAFRAQPLVEFMHTTSEVAEIHSMTMEHFTYPWMDKFFGENTEKFLYAHLAQALMTIPYLVCVDEYQHRVFENVNMTAKERRAVWHEIEQTYMPWRDYDGNEFLSEGGFWMQKQHIFLYPFYYIDYALAQICAFQFYVKNKKDHESTWKDYLALCAAGGSMGYRDLLKLANLNCPFDEGTVESALKDVFKELNID